MKMNWRQPGYANDSHKIIQSVQKGGSDRAGKHLNGAAHCFKVFDLKMDACAICRKPRSEHPKAQP